MTALNKQVSGTHYKDLAIQPIEYIHANGLDFFQGNVVKYVTRHKAKNGKADIEKAIHYLEMILQLQYGEETKLMDLPVIDDGWVTWDGGKNPFNQNTAIEVRFRDKDEFLEPNSNELRWDHIDSPGDIIAYKVVK